MDAMILVDGSMGEGGGQLLRYAVALAALLQKPVKVYNIRAKRSNPGLRPQHLTAIKLIASLVKAEVKGLEVGSREVVVVPRERPRGGRIDVNIGTAGSISLLLQACLPVLLAARGPVELKIRGGTNVKWSPPIHYMKNVLLPLLGRFGVKCSIEILKLGFYPRGGGLIRVVAQPSYPLASVSLGMARKIKEIRGISYAANLPRHVAERQARAAREAIKRAGYGSYIAGIEVDTSTPAVGVGSGVVVWAVTDAGIIGGDALGERGKRAEVVGEEAASKLVASLRSGASVDPNALDNLIIYMALASGSSSIYAPSLTSHAETAIGLCQSLAKARFTVSREDELVRVSASGIAYSPA